MVRMNRAKGSFLPAPPPPPNLQVEGPLSRLTHSVGHSCDGLLSVQTHSQQRQVWEKTRTGSKKTWLETQLCLLLALGQVTRSFCLQIPR